MTQTRPPALAFVLGFAGTLPFAASTVVLWNGSPAWHETALTAMSAYAFIILSFLGGVHWGAALTRERPLQLIWSVVPSLAALFSAFLPPPAMLATMAAAYLVAGVVDVTVFRRIGPSWYVTLRIWLTIIVAPLILAAAFAPHLVGIPSAAGQ